MGCYSPKARIFCVWITSLLCYTFIVDGSVIFLSKPEKPKIIPDTGKTWFDKDKPSFNFDGPAVGRPFLPDQESPYKIFDTVAELSPFSVFSHHTPATNTANNKNDVGKSTDPRLAQTLDGDTYYGIRAHDLIESPDKISDQSEDVDTQGALVPPGELNSSIPRKEDYPHNLESPIFSSHDLPQQHELTLDKDTSVQRDQSYGTPSLFRTPNKNNVDKNDEGEHEEHGVKIKSDTIIAQTHPLPRIVNQKPPPIHVTESTPTELDREAEKPTSAMVPNEAPAFSVNDVINSEKAAMSFAKQFGDVFPEGSSEGIDHEKHVPAPPHILESHGNFPKLNPPGGSHESSQQLGIHPNVISHLVKHMNSKHSSGTDAKDKKHHHVTIDTDTGEIVNEAVVTVPDSSKHKQVKNDIEKISSDVEKPIARHEPLSSPDDAPVDSDLQAASLLGGGIQENEKERDSDRDFHKNIAENSPPQDNQDFHEKNEDHEHIHDHEAHDYSGSRDSSRQESFFSQERNIDNHDNHNSQIENGMNENRHFKNHHDMDENRNHQARMLPEEITHSNQEMMHEGNGHRNFDDASHESDSSPPEETHLVSHYDYHDMHGASNGHRDEPIDPETSFDHHDHGDRHHGMNRDSDEPESHELQHDMRDEYHENRESHEPREPDSRDGVDDNREQENEGSENENDNEPHQVFHRHESVKDLSAYYPEHRNKESVKFLHKGPESEDIPEMSRGKASEKKKPDFGDFDKEFPPKNMRNKHRKGDDEKHNDLLLHHDSASNLHLEKEHESDKEMHHDDHDADHDEHEVDEHDADIDHDDDDNGDEHEYTKEEPDDEHEEDHSRLVSSPQTHYHKHIHHHNHIHIHSPAGQRLLKNGYRHIKLHDMDTISNAMDNSMHDDHGHHSQPKVRPDIHPFNPRSDEFQPEDDIEKQLALPQPNPVDPTHQYPFTKPMDPSSLIGKYSPSPVPPEESAPLKTEPVQPVFGSHQLENDKLEDDGNDAMMKPENGMKAPEPLHPSERLGEPSNKSAMKDDDDGQYGSEYYHMVEGVKKLKKVGRFLPSSDTQDHVHENEVFDNNNLTNDIVLSKDMSTKRHAKRPKKPSFAMEPKIESQHEVVEPGYMVHEDPRGDGLGAGVIDGPEIGSPVSSPPDIGSSSKREQLNVTTDTILKEDEKDKPLYKKQPEEETNNMESPHHQQTQHLLSYPPGTTTVKVLSGKHADKAQSEEANEIKEKEESKTQSSKEMSKLLRSDSLQKFASHIIRNQTIDEHGDHGDSKNYEEGQRKSSSDEEKDKKQPNEEHSHSSKHSNKENLKDTKFYNSQLKNAKENEDEHEKPPHFTEEEHQREHNRFLEEGRKEPKLSEGDNVQEKKHASEVQDNVNYYPHERELRYGTPQKSRLFSSIQEHLQNIEVDDLNKLQEEIKFIKSKKLYKAKTVSPVSRSPQKAHLNLDVRSNKYKIPEQQLTLPLQNPGHPDDMNGVIDTSTLKPSKKMPLLNPSPVADLEEDAASKKHILAPKRTETRRGSPKDIITRSNQNKGEIHDDYGMVTLHGTETDYDLEPFVIASKYKRPYQVNTLKASTKNFINANGDARSLVRTLKENHKSMEERISTLIDRKGLSHLEESPIMIGEHHSDLQFNVEKQQQKIINISKKSSFERPLKKLRKKKKNLRKSFTKTVHNNKSIVDAADVPKIRKRVLSFKRSAEKLDIK